jgi:glycine C-acetyltransferase
MSVKKITRALSQELRKLREKGIHTGPERVVTGIRKGKGDKGLRILLKGYRNREFIRMNSNSYLGLGLKDEVIQAEEKTATKFGAGPGAGRSLSGTYDVHVELEKKLAKFHNKEAGMIFSSAYATVIGSLASLITEETIVISDELNHNCIINGIRLARPKEKKICSHNNTDELEIHIKESVGKCKRLIIVTDGIFSMRGECAPLPKIADLAEKYDSEFPEGILTIVDDSHGVGAIGKTGRGTMEMTAENRVDILISTLGKALGINGGYLVSKAEVVEYLKQTAPFYVYSNPITPSEASAALKALEILDSEKGKRLLEDLREKMVYFRNGLIDLGYEVIRAEHPIVPLMIRDTDKTKELVNFLKDNGIFTAGIFYPIVPRGDELIRFQISTDHTKSDLNYVLKVLEKYKNKQC